MSHDTDVSNHSDLSLIEFMTVTPTEDSAVFVGRSEAYGQIGIYGGHYLGQSLSAAFQTVPEPMLAQSYHGYFLNRRPAILIRCGCGCECPGARR